MAAGVNILGINSPEQNDTDYVQKIIDSFNAVDTHDHSSGKGLPVQRVADGVIVTATLADNSVTTSKIIDAAVTHAKLDGTTTSSSMEMSNLSITASVATNALTIAVKTKAGADAGASTPATISFRSATAASGAFVTRSITGALSMVVSSGSTLGHVSAQPQFIFVYAIDNAGTVELAVTGTRVGEGSLQSTTAEGGAGAADSKTVLYSTTARTNVAVRLIGRIKTTEAAAGTWATTPSEVSTVPLGTASDRSEIAVNTGSGYGSGSTKIRRFTNITNGSNGAVITGSAITFTTAADQTTLGAVFTVNEDGLYFITYSDNFTGGSGPVGISLNSSQLTTTIQTINEGDRLIYADTSAANFASDVAVMAFLQAGDVIRAHTNGQASGTSAGAKFRMLKVAG